MSLNNFYRILGSSPIDASNLVFFNHSRALRTIDLPHNRIVCALELVSNKNLLGFHSPFLRFLRVTRTEKELPNPNKFYLAQR